MSEDHDTPLPDTSSSAVKEVRYSYREMMDEVVEERKHSIMGRELIDAEEISQMFKKSNKKIKKS
ncbi:MAG: hypothetical protein NWT02_12635 [Opitutales bacterium]|jgi:hypothetical protein|nr:hypothetical protein [Opitutales bacterium]MDP4644634.1 hypothetical protein [Opitutales bacterium]MDP4693829.1 hypothetical protein [Opitutales bacterium]MDP4776693.1 hypothetical protein [Opitutales bacterium]MDP4884641.1 hypothetical protein [Opitutales bacterium]